MTTTAVNNIERFADDIEVGDAIPAVIHRPTEVQLFRYCAVTWNAHRIHFDAAYAESEGYPNVLVQSHLHGAFFTSLCTGWAGEHGDLRRLQYSVRRFACPGDLLAVRGTVESIDDSVDGGVLVRVELREVRESDGADCAIGDADIFLPHRSAVAGGEGEKR
ncbi:acyl dehydratase [Nocardia sp. NPDC058518]|uniref:acyl dehydratase n=1 Tax=Nocardia sp. NPDC058518 TaxID=3346534 RepID=UPI00365D5C1D